MTYRKLDEPVECSCGKMTDNRSGLCDDCLKEEKVIEVGEEERYERVMRR